MEKMVSLTVTRSGKSTFERFFEGAVPKEEIQERFEEICAEIGYDAFFSWNRYAIARHIAMLKPQRKAQTKPVEREDLLLIHTGVCSEDSVLCYALGRYAPSIVMSAMSIEAALSFELLQKDAQVAGKTLGDLIKLSKKHAVLPNEDSKKKNSPTLKCTELNELRNNLVHLNEAKTSAFATEEMIKKAFGSEWTGALRETIDEGPLRRDAKRAINLSYEILEYLWGAFHESIVARK